MELWEFNECVKAFNQDKKDKNKEVLAICYQIAAFTGQAFAGKLKKLSYYLKDEEVVKVKALTKEQCLEIDEKAAMKRGEKIGN